MRTPLACQGGISRWTHVLLACKLPFSQAEAAELFPASSFLDCKVHLPHAHTTFPYHFSCEFN